MPAHIARGSMSLLLLALSCFAMQIIVHLCFSMFFRLSRSVVAPRARPSALRAAGGTRACREQATWTQQELTVWSSAVPHRRQIKIFTCLFPCLLCVSLRTMLTFAKYFPQFEFEILKELQGQQSQSLSGIITFSLSSLTNEKYNTANYRIKLLRGNSAKSMVRPTAVQKGDGSHVPLNTFLSLLGFTFIIFLTLQLYT